MATELAEHCFEILPYADADSGIAFGAGLGLSVDQEGFKPGGIEVAFDLDVEFKRLARSSKRYQGDR